MDFYHLIVTSDMKYIVSGGVGGVRAWDFQTGKFSHNIFRTVWPVKQMGLLPDGNHVVFRDHDKFSLLDHCRICICNTHTGDRVWRSHNNLYFGWQVGALNNDEIVYLEGYGGVAIYRWRWRSEKRSRLLITYSYFIDELRATIDGNYIVFIDRNDNLVVLDVPKEEIVQSLYGYIDMIPHPDCERAICKTTDQELHIIELQSGRIVQTLETNGEAVDRYSSLAITSDGQYVATEMEGIESDARIVNVWDMNTGHLSWSITDDNPYRFRNITFTPDGRYLVAGGRERVKMWDCETQQCVLSFLTDEPDPYWGGQ